jgi:hypothetical protein
VNTDYLASRASARNKFVAIYDGCLALGFIVLRRQHKFEAFDRDGRSLGLFATRRKAARAIEGRQRVAS